MVESPQYLVLLANDPIVTHDDRPVLLHIVDVAVPDRPFISRVPPLSYRN